MKMIVDKVLHFGTSACAALAACVALSPALAFASGEESGGISAILPNMDEFIPMLVAFIILWIILAKFGWPIFDGMITKRNNTIRESLEKSEEARVESERVLAEYKQELESAKQQATQIIADAKKTGEAAKAGITEAAQKEAADMIEKARAAIETEKKAAAADLQSSVADTSVALASKLFGEGLSVEEHRALIERYVNEAGSFNAG